jgi:hypothetical protein
MQVIKFKTVNQSSNEESKKLLTALDLKNIPVKFFNEIFEVESNFIPSVNNIAKIIGIKIELVSVGETLGADSPYYGTVRHAIEFYGTTANIPNSLKLFPGFVYNPDKARISFIVANGTALQKGIISKTVYSTDPKIQEFNQTFSLANPKIDWSKVKTYDFAVNESQPVITQTQTQNPRPNPNPIPGPKPINPETPTKKDGSGDEILLVAVIGVIGLLLSGNKSKKRR